MSTKNKNRWTPCVIATIIICIHSAVSTVDNTKAIGISIKAEGSVPSVPSLDASYYQKQAENNIYQNYDKLYSTAKKYSDPKLGTQYTSNPSEYQTLESDLKYLQSTAKIPDYGTSKYPPKPPAYDPNYSSSKMSDYGSPFSSSSSQYDSNNYSQSDYYGPPGPPPGPPPHGHPPPGPPPHGHPPHGGPPPHGPPPHGPPPPHGSSSFKDYSSSSDYDQLYSPQTPGYQSSTRNSYNQNQKSRNYDVAQNYENSMLSSTYQKTSEYLEKRSPELPQASQIVSNNLRDRRSVGGSKLDRRVAEPNHRHFRRSVGFNNGQNGKPSSLDRRDVEENKRLKIQRRTPQPHHGKRKKKNKKKKFKKPGWSC